MSIAQINAFLNETNKANRVSQKKVIYNHIKRNPYTCIEHIKDSYYLYKKETIVGRVSELCDLGVVKYVGNENNSKLVIVVNKEEQISLFNNRNKNKRLKAINSLLNNHKDALNDKTIYQLELERSLIKNK